MKNVKILLLLTAFMAVPALGQDVNVKLSWPQQYRWHGWQIYGDNVVHPGAAATVRGVEIGTVTHIDDELQDDFDTTVSAQLPLIDGICVTGGYGYFILPTMDAQELALTLSVPGVVSPRYTVSHVVPDNAENGQIHTFCVDVFLGDPEEISALLTAQVEYNDGVNPFGGPVIRDFTHILAGLTVNVPMQGFVLQPAVFYQHTFEELVEPKRNEVWWGIGVQYNF